MVLNYRRKKDQSNKVTLLYRNIITLIIIIIICTGIYRQIGICRKPVILLLCNTGAGFVVTKPVTMYVIMLRCNMFIAR